MMMMVFIDKGQVFRKILSSDLTSLDTSLMTDEEISSEVTAQEKTSKVYTH